MHGAGVKKWCTGSSAEKRRMGECGVAESRCMGRAQRRCVQEERGEKVHGLSAEKRCTGLTRRRGTWGERGKQCRRSSARGERGEERRRWRTPLR